MIENFITAIAIVTGVPLVGLSLLTLVRIANSMGLSSIFGTKTSGEVAKQ
jgi:hypothetical protein